MVRQVPVVERADGLDSADGVGEEDLVGGEQVVQRELLLAHLLPARARQLDRSPAGDAGDDAPVGRRCEEDAVTGREEVGPRSLEDRAVGVEQQGQLISVGGGGEAIERAAVGPLVRAKATLEGEAAQRDPVLGRREHLRRVDLGGRDGGLQGISLRRDGEAESAVADLARTLADRRPRVGGKLDPEQRRDAGGEALDVGVDLDRVPVEDEKGLEDAPGGVGMGRAAHGGDILTPMTTTSEAVGGALAGDSQLLVRRIDGPIDAERAFVHLYGESPNAFWLDSSAEGERGRFSFIGDAHGPLAAVVTYDVGEGLVRIERGGVLAVRRESIFDFLSRALPAPGATAPELPFDFDCGFAGYLGYELKAECGGFAAHSAPTPDAAFVFADRMVAFDHAERCSYLLALTSLPSRLHRLWEMPSPGRDAPEPSEGAERWVEETARQLRALPSPPKAEAQESRELRLRRSRERYLEDIAACKRHLTAGHSYEICLTNKVVAKTEAEPLALYRTLRRANPAPFAALLRFGDLAVLSASPERFLSIDRRGWAESRPIKGTIGRAGSANEDARLAGSLAADEKSRAENVTIVDLVRNDLGRVCEAGSVNVAQLARIETYATVHHLVSSVRGRLCKDVGQADCVRACFPPGSMTGAPKARTMEIIDELEGEARGVYSGAIGYFGLGGGCDLSVAIRTIVAAGGCATAGSGGAIVSQSVPEEEFEEVLLKVRAQIAALSTRGAAMGIAGFPPLPASAD